MICISKISVASSVVFGFGIKKKSSDQGSMVFTKTMAQIRLRIEFAPWYIETTYSWSVYL